MKRKCLLLSLAILIVGMATMTAKVAFTQLTTGVNFRGTVTYESPFVYNKYDQVRIYNNSMELLHTIGGIGGGPTHAYSGIRDMTGGAQWINIQPWTAGEDPGCLVHRYWNGTDEVIEQDLVFNGNCTGS